MATIFEFLFKFRPLIFEKGKVALHAPWPWYVTALLAFASLIAAFLLYRRTMRVIELRWRLLLTGLRSWTLVAVLIVFLQPVLILHTSIPQSNFVAVVYDNSKSMEIRDGVEGKSRLEIVRDLLGASAGSPFNELATKFKLRFFQFAMDARRVPEFQDSIPHGNLTDLERTLGQVVSEMGNSPLAGIVLLTDGVDNHARDLKSVAARLRAGKIPVSAIGIGSPFYARDIDVVRAEAPRKVLGNTMVEADVTVHATGYTGRNAKLQVKDGNRILQSQEVKLGDDSDVKTHRVSFNGGSPGVKLLTFSIDPFPDENIVQNNGTSILLEVSDEKPKILYVEGEPRWIYGFLRRAASEDKNLRLVSLLRQADGKNLRQGIETPTELENGFPSNASEIFNYKGLILGSVEASYFSYEQLRLISEFVNRRGGGFIMLGGRNSFAQGGYVNTPLEDVLPVSIRVGDGRTGAPEFQDLKFKVRPTTYGLRHPVMRLSESDLDTSKRWNAAPELLGVNPTTGAKPGATVLAYGSAPDPRGQSPIVLAFQRFGEGKSIALTTASTWKWRMGLNHQDNLHEVFWRQLLRWLVNDVPDRVTVRPEKQIYPKEEQAVVKAEICDDAFLAVNDAEVTAQIKSPSGKTTDLPLEWNAARDGEYSATFKPEEEGFHEISVGAVRGEKDFGKAKGYFHIGEAATEFHNAAMNLNLLRQLAEETGGHVYTPEGLKTLPEDISFTEAGATRIEERQLWDMPFLFLILAGSLIGEWALRKKRGLA